MDAKPHLNPPRQGRGAQLLRAGAVVQPKPHPHPIACRILATIRSACFSRHSLIRITFHPSLLSRPFTDRSLLRFPSIFAFQKARFCLGSRKQRGHPCQKQPSTKTATFCFRKAKSGRPGMGKCLRQPIIPAFRMSFASLISVFSFPLPRIRDMTSDRLDLDQMSVKLPSALQFDPYATQRLQDEHGRARFLPRQFWHRLVPTKTCELLILSLFWVCVLFVPC